MGLRRARFRDTNAEDGFTLIELTVATGVMLVAIVAMLGTTYAGFRGIATARQRQTANALANQAMERIRALSFDTVTHGLDNTDLSTNSDSRIVHAGTSYSFGGEEIPHGDNPATPPLVPHQSTVVENNVTYTVSSYLTYYQNNTTSNTFRATVIVTWAAHTGTSAISQVQVQSVLYSPGSSKTHPFPAPSQPFLYGTASQSPGQINLTGTIYGIGVDHAALWMPSQTSSSQNEQILAVFGSAQTSGATLQLTGQSEQSGGRQAVTSGSDNDPGQSKPGYQTASIASQSNGTLTATGNNDTLSVSWGTGDTAATTSTVNASTALDSASPAKFGPCPLLVPSSAYDLTQNDGEPCGSSKGTQGGTLSLAVGIKAGPNTINATLASIGAPLTGSGAFTNRDVTAEATVCKLVPPGSAGCVQAQQYRALGTVTLMKLPIGLTDLLPLTDLPGYDSTKGLLQLTGFSDAVSSEAGVGAGAPSASVGAGTITYFNGAGYSTQAVTSNSTPISIGLSGAGVHLSDTLILGALLNIDITANISTGGTSISDPSAGCTSPCTRTSAEAQSNSPIIGNLTYKLTYAGSVYADVNLSVDLGTLLAKTSYTPAPSGG